MASALDGFTFQVFPGLLQRNHIVGVLKAPELAVDQVGGGGWSREDVVLCLAVGLWSNKEPFCQHRDPTQAGAHSVLKRLLPFRVELKIIFTWSD